jgi:hypothetical protein
VRRWRESWWLIGKNRRTLFDRPKPTADCSANGRRRKKFSKYILVNTGSIKIHLLQTWVTDSLTGKDILSYF